MRGGRSAESRISAGRDILRAAQVGAENDLHRFFLLAALRAVRARPAPATRVAVFGFDARAALRFEGGSVFDFDRVATFRFGEGAVFGFDGRATFGFAVAVFGFLANFALAAWVSLTRCWWCSPSSKTLQVSIDLPSQ